VHLQRYLSRGKLGIRYRAALVCCSWPSIPAWVAPAHHPVARAKVQVLKEPQCELSRLVALGATYRENRTDPGVQPDHGAHRRRRRGGPRRL